MSNCFPPGGTSVLLLAVLPLGVAITFSGFVGVGGLFDLVDLCSYELKLGAVCIDIVGM